jgi:outer membrane receptor protein involved in Fe transport
LAVFRTQFRNLQVAALDGTEFFVGNAARAHTQGIEFSAHWRSSFGLGLTSDLGYLDARYDSYQNAPATADSSEDSQDLSGQPLQRAPRFSGSVQLDYLTGLPGLKLPMALGLVAEGASHQFLNIDLDPIDAQPGYVRYNAYMAFSSRSQRFTLRLIGRNLEDRVVRREAADVAIVGAHSVGLFPPRSFAAELGYRF